MPLRARCPGRGPMVRGPGPGARDCLFCFCSEKRTSGTESKATKRALWIYQIMSGGPGLCQTESSWRVYECDVYIVFAVYRRGASAHDALLKFFNTSEYILGAWNTERNACLCEPGARGVAHGSGPGPGGPGLCQTESSLRVSICVSCTHGHLRYSARGRP